MTRVGRLPAGGLRRLRLLRLRWPLRRLVCHVAPPASDDRALDDEGESPTRDQGQRYRFAQQMRDPMGTSSGCSSGSDGSDGTCDPTNVRGTRASTPPRLTLWAASSSVGPDIERPGPCPWGRAVNLFDADQGRIVGRVDVRWPSPAPARGNPRRLGLAGSLVPSERTVARAVKCPRALWAGSRCVDRRMVDLPEAASNT